MKRESYITILGWFVNDLKLKGNELLCYSIIYGFSQDGESEFTGSINYLSKWLNTSRQTIITCLKSLTDKGLLIKTEITKNNIKFNNYKAVLGVVKKLDHQSKDLIGGSQEIGPGVVKNFDPIYINNNNNIYIVEIVGYLNEKCGTKYTTTNKKTVSFINARLQDNYTVQDFKDVIDIKSSKWLGTEYAIYLRPETLFGTKFENYLNEKIVADKQNIKKGSADEIKYAN